MTKMKIQYQVGNFPASNDESSKTTRQITLYLSFKADHGAPISDLRMYKTGKRIFDAILQSRCRN